jgi:hypothetical protein
MPRGRRELLFAKRALANVRIIVAIVSTTIAMGLLIFRTLVVTAARNVIPATVAIPRLDTILTPAAIPAV